MKNRKAPEGYWLTQANLEDENNRIFVHEVCGYGDLDNIYTLYSDQQKEEWEQEHPQEGDGQGND